MDKKNKNLNEEKNGNINIINDSSPTTLPEIGQKTLMVRQSGHMTEQLLISCKERNALIEEHKKTIQVDIFEDFNKKNNAKIIKDSFEIEDIGCRLTPQEHRLITAIRNELFDKSNKDMGSESYYMGNYFPNGRIITKTFGGHPMPVPHILVPRSDFYKSFLGKDRYSGKEQQIISKLLFDFSQKYFLTLYKQHIKINSETKINLVREYLPLIRLKHIEQGLSEDQSELLERGIDCIVPNSNSSYLISINPIWVDQIKTKWVEFPHDINIRLGKSVGHWNKVTPAMMNLITYLLHQRSNKNFKTEINEDNLITKMSLDKYIARRERKRADMFLHEAIKVCKEIGLCKEAIKTEGANAQIKWIFQINEVIPVI